MRLVCRSCTPKQIDLQAFLILQLPYRISMLLLKSGCKSAPAQYKRHYYLPPPQALLRKIKTKLMLCKPLFIIHGRIKGLLKLYNYTGVQEQSTSAQKVGVAHA